MMTVKVCMSDVKASISFLLTWKYASPMPSIWVTWMDVKLSAGGTFALYSLICRHAKVSLLPNQLASDARISSFRLKVPSPELERSLRIKERLEASITLKRLLLMLVLAGTSMVIADGVVTPAMSGFLFSGLLYSTSIYDFFSSENFRASSERRNLYCAYPKFYLDY